MTVAYDAYSFDTTTPYSFTHTPVGVPRAVIVFIIQFGHESNQVSAVTYGGESLSRTAWHGKATGEKSSVNAWFLGSGIPVGAQTVVVTETGGSPKMVGCVTLTALTDTIVQDFDITISADSVTNPTAILARGAVVCYSVEGFMSGTSGVGGCTPYAGWSQLQEHDFGTQVGAIYHHNTPDTGNLTMGWTQTNEDAVAIGVAVTEIEEIFAPHLQVI